MSKRIDRRVDYLNDRIDRVDERLGRFIVMDPFDENIGKATGVCKEVKVMREQIRFFATRMFESARPDERLALVQDFKRNGWDELADELLMRIGETAPAES